MSEQLDLPSCSSAQGVKLMPCEGENAVAIAQSVLEQNLCAIHSVDFDAFAQDYLLPAHFETFAESAEIQNTQQLFLIYQTIQNFHRQVRYTDVVRSCIAAAFSDPDHINVMFETRFLDGQTVVLGPIVSQFQLTRSDGWKIVRCSYALDPAKIAYSRFPDGLKNPREGKE